VGIGSYSTLDAMGVAFAGNHVFLADGNDGLKVFDIVSPENPDLVTSMPLAARALGADVTGDLLCVAVNTSGLQVLDISVPETPVPLGIVATPGRAMDVVARGSLAFVADFDQGLQIVDISDPESPAIIGDVELVNWGKALDLAVYGDMVYLACELGGLYLIDVSNPESPEFLSFLNTSGRALGAAATRSFAYITDSEVGLLIADVSDSSNPVCVGTLSALDGDSQSVVINGNHAYFVDQTPYDNSWLRIAWRDCGDLTGAVPGQAAPLALLPAFPNPFNPSVRIAFTLEHGQQVKLQVLDISGRLLDTVVDGTYPAGHHELQWTGRDAKNRPLASGVYLLRLKSPSGIATGKLTLLR
jgi:hypothetical protein